MASAAAMVERSFGFDFVDIQSGMPGEESGQVWRFGPVAAT